METLIQKLNEASFAYYNGRPIMTDHEWDAMFDKLKAEEKRTGIVLPDSPTNNVGANAKGKKIAHEYPALSLDKTKSIDDILKAFPDESVLMWKLDGLTGQLTYENGKLVIAATRGNGEIGQDILEKTPFISDIPQSIPVSGKWVIRGEILMSYSEFNRINDKYDGIYENPRNLASGTLSSDLAVLKDRKLEFHAFNLVHFENTNLPTFQDRLDTMKTLGFDTVDNIKCISQKLLAKNIEAMTKEALTYDIPVDGLVVADNNAAKYDNLPGTGHHPNVKKGYALKWQDEEVETTLREIEWSASRTGLLNPVAVFDPVSLEGTTVTRATLHNVSYVEEKRLTPGNHISVYKANKIIPAVATNLSFNETPEVSYDKIICPACGKMAEASTTKNAGRLVKTMWCKNPHCPAKAIGKYVHFVERDCMNIMGLSEATIEKMIDAGFIKEFADFYRFADDEATQKQMMSWEGFGEKAVTNLVAAIRRSAQNVEFVPFIHALGISNIGKGQAKLLLKYFSCSVPQFLNTVCKGFDYTVINGIGDVLSESLNDYITKEMSHPDSELQNLLTTLHFKTAETQKCIMQYDDFEIWKNGNSYYVKDNSNPENNGKTVKCIKRIPIDETNDIIALGGDYNGEEYNEPYASAWNIDVSSQPFEGKTFVVTGSVEHFANRDAVHQFIEDHGGKTSGSVSKNTSYLVNNDITSTSGKNKKAKELGVPIISEQDLLNMIK